MLIYNNQQHQFYGYMRQRTLTINDVKIPINKWLPISTGPRMLAWGSLDSLGTIRSGSGNFTIDWNTENNWYELGITSHSYHRDSMLLMITPVGNGSWDQTVTTGEIFIGPISKASIKFVDVSRIVAGFSELDRRRKSYFHFVLYDLRQSPYQ